MNLLGVNYLYASGKDLRINPPVNGIFWPLNIVALFFPFGWNLCFC